MQELEGQEIYRLEGLDMQELEGPVIYQLEEEGIQQLEEQLIYQLEGRVRVIQELDDLANTVEEQVFQQLQQCSSYLKNR